MACGSFHTLAVTAAGEVYSWGWGGMRLYHLGGLGLGSYADAAVPTRIEGFGSGAPGLTKIVQVRVFGGQLPVQVAISSFHNEHPRIARS